MRRIFLAVLLVSCSVALKGQATEIRPGIRIRINAPGIVSEQFTGTLLSRTPDTLVVGGPDVAPLAVPLARITSLEVGHGKSHWRGAYKGTLWGGGIGAGLALATVGSLHVCSATNSARTCDQPTTDSEKQAYLTGATFAGVIYGVIIGAIIGSERWDRFEVVTKTAFEVRDGRPSLSFSRAF